MVKFAIKDNASLRHQIRKSVNNKVIRDYGLTDEVELAIRLNPIKENYETIYDAFIWDKTMRGWGYWNILYNEIIKKSNVIQHKLLVNYKLSYVKV